MKQLVTILLGSALTLAPQDVHVLVLVHGLSHRVLSRARARGHHQPSASGSSRTSAFDEPLPGSLYLSRLHSAREAILERQLNRKSGRASAPQDSDLSVPRDGGVLANAGIGDVVLVNAFARGDARRLDNASGDASLARTGAGPAELLDNEALPIRDRTEDARVVAKYMGGGRNPADMSYITQELVVGERRYRQLGKKFGSANHQRHPGAFEREPRGVGVEKTAGSEASAKMQAGEGAVGGATGGAFQGLGGYSRAIEMIARTERAAHHVVGAKTGLSPDLRGAAKRKTLRTVGGTVEKRMEKREVVHL